jgi:predicted DNA-binding transcriptional regulator AlpA
MNSTCNIQELEFFKLEEVLNKFKISQAKLYRLVREKRFPGPVKIGTSNRWLLSDFDSYLAEQIEAARNGGAK